MLAIRVKIYNLDWHLVREHRTQPGGAPSGWDELTMDERWLLPSPEQMAEREIASWTARSRLVIDDLLRLPRDRTVIAEGPAVFPWWVEPLLSSRQQAIFLIAEPTWRSQVYERRYRDDPLASSAGRTTDPARATANIAARDAFLAERIRRSCEELGLRYEIMDASRDIDDSLELP